MRPTDLGFWLANLDPSDTKPNGSGGGSGLIACWERCPHLGATVPWMPHFAYEGTTGWYRCPSHGATFTKSGIRVFGPSPRSLDTMRVTVDVYGTITVDTNAITNGGPDNPARAIDHPRLPTG